MKYRTLHVYPFHLPRDLHREDLYDVLVVIVGFRMIRFLEICGIILFVEMNKDLSECYDEFVSVHLTLLRLTAVYLRNFALLNRS